MKIWNCIEALIAQICPEAMSVKGWLARYRIVHVSDIRWKAMLMPSTAIFGNAYPTAFLQVAKIGMMVLIGALMRSSATLIHVEFGEASWYGPGFHGLETASGEIFDSNKMIAAHPTLPLGTSVEVTNLEKDKKVEVRIIDRGPYVQGRAIDLSHAAAKKLGMVKDGTAEVKIKVKTVNKKGYKKSPSKKRKVSKKIRQTD